MWEGESSPEFHICKLNKFYTSGKMKRDSISRHFHRNRIPRGKTTFQYLQFLRNVVKVK